MPAFLTLDSNHPIISLYIRDGTETFNFLFVLHFSLQTSWYFFLLLLIVSVAVQLSCHVPSLFPLLSDNIPDCLPSTKAVGRDLIASAPIWVALRGSWEVTCLQDGDTQHLNVHLQSVPNFHQASSFCEWAQMLQNLLHRMSCLPLWAKLHQSWSCFSHFGSCCLG